MTIRTPNDISGGWWLTRTARVSAGEKNQVDEWSSWDGTKVFETDTGQEPVFTRYGVDFTEASGQHLIEAVASSHANDFTIGVIYRERTATSFGSIFARATSQSDQRSWILGNLSGVLNFSVSSAGTSASTTNVAISGQTVGLVNALVIRKSGTTVSVWSNGGAKSDTGSFPATVFDSTAPITIGDRKGGVGTYVSPIDGDVRDVVYYPSALTDTECENISEWMQAEKLGIVLDGTVSFGSLSVLTKDVSLVQEPSGDTVTDGDFDSYTYLHHPFIHADAAGNIFVSFSAGGEDEDTDGQMVCGKRSTDRGATWSSLQEVIPPQSDLGFSGPGGTILFPNSFATIGHDVYVMAVLSERAGNAYTGYALLARRWDADGTLGTLFRCSPESYTPDATYTEIPYDSDLGPELLEKAVLYGRYGGSTASQVFRWSRWFPLASGNLVAPSTIQIPGRPLNHLMRLTRLDITATDSFVRCQDSIDGGMTFLANQFTELQDTPSNTWAVVLDDGSIAISGNPDDDSGVKRGTLYLAITDPYTRVVTYLGDLATYADDTANTPGAFKDGAASYVHMVQQQNYIYAVYSKRKEEIEFSRILIPGRTDNDNDPVPSASGGGLLIHPGMSGGIRG